MAGEKRAPPSDLIAALVLDAAALAVFELRDGPGRLYAEASGAFYFLAAASALLSVAMARARAIAWFRAWAGLWLFLFLMLTYQFGLGTECRILLFLGFLALLSGREAFPLSMALCLSASAAAALVYALDAGEELAPARAAAAGLVALCSILGSASVALSGLASYRRRSGLLEAEEREAKDVMRRLAEAQLGYLEFARTAGRRSSTDERNRLSAELHDTIGYTLTNLEMILEAGADLVDADREKLKDLLETGLSQVRASMVETRRALYLIRGQEDRLLFPNAVQELASVFGKTTGMEVSIDFGAFPRACGEEIESALYHFIQEGLVNAFSHGKAKRVKVYLGVDSENLRASVIDDGIGAQDIVEGIGILGMRERFGRLGGTLSIESPVDGFKITATVPTGG